MLERLSVAIWRVHRTAQLRPEVSEGVFKEHNNFSQFGTQKILDYITLAALDGSDEDDCAEEEVADVYGAVQFADPKFSPTHSPGSLSQKSKLLTQPVHPDVLGPLA